jgi:hypothetical protein
MDMNQDQVKEQLQNLHQSSVAYNVLFSGKKSTKVNGLYKFGTAGETPEIIIHNGNFLREDGTQNDTLLLFTAIHELAHHILITEKGSKSPHAHSQLFWATFHDLLDRAEKAGIYKPEIDTETQKVIDEVRDISKQIVELQRRLGHILMRVQELCATKGLRYEDIIQRHAQISASTEKMSVAAYHLGDQGVTADIQAEAAKQRNEDKREAILAVGHEGKSVVQAKTGTAAPARAPEHEDEAVSLIKEKRRIERTIESLTHRLEKLNELLEERSESE